MATAVMSSQGSQPFVEAAPQHRHSSGDGIGMPLGADDFVDETRSEKRFNETTSQDLKDSPISPADSHGSFTSKDLNMSKDDDDDAKEEHEAQPRDSSLNDQPPSGNAQDLDMSSMSCPTTSKNIKLPV
jgi:hypothetical protein